MLFVVIKILQRLLFISHVSNGDYLGEISYTIMLYYKLRQSLSILHSKLIMLNFLLGAPIFYSIYNLSDILPLAYAYITE